MKAENGLEFSFEGLHEVDGVEAVDSSLEVVLGLLGNVRGIQKPLTGSLWDRVDLSDFGVDAFPGFEFEGWPEVIAQEGAFVGVQVVDGSHEIGVGEPFVAQKLTDVGPLFLLHVGVVIGVIGAAPGKLDGLRAFLKIADQVMV